MEEVKEELAKGGCKPGVCGPRVRTVTACQGNQICPSGNIDTYDIAKKLDARYYARSFLTSSSSVSQDARTTV